MNEQSYKLVFDLLVKHRSMPLLEICALTNLEAKDVREIVDELESRNHVRVTNKLDAFNEIVTLREAAFTATRAFSA